MDHARTPAGSRHVQVRSARSMQVPSSVSPASPPAPRCHARRIPDPPFNPRDCISAQRSAGVHHRNERGRRRCFWHALEHNEHPGMQNARGKPQPSPGFINQCSRPVITGASQADGVAGWSNEFFPSISASRRPQRIKPSAHRHRLIQRGNALHTQVQHQSPPRDR